MKLLVENMYEKGCITAVNGDKCRSQFSDLCGKASSSLKSNFSAYSVKVNRLDTFYYDIIGQDIEFAELFSVVKLVLILAHGNATVESGFSVNKDMLVENLHEKSLVAQRTVYEAVQSAGGISYNKLTKTFWPMLEAHMPDMWRHSIVNAKLLLKLTSKQQQREKLVLKLSSSKSRNQI